jgi:hypothetical protein
LFVRARDIREFFLQEENIFVLTIFIRLSAYEKQSGREGRTDTGLLDIYRHLAESSIAISKLRVKPDIFKVKAEIIIISFYSLTDLVF